MWRLNNTPGQIVKMLFDEDLSASLAKTHVDYDYDTIHVIQQYVRIPVHMKFNARPLVIYLNEPRSCTGFPSLPHARVYLRLNL